MKNRIKNNKVLIGGMCLSTALVIMASQEQKQPSNYYMDANKNIAGVSLDSDISLDYSTEMLESVFASSYKYSSSNTLKELDAIKLNKNNINIGYTPAVSGTDNDVFEDVKVQTDNGTTTETEKKDDNVLNNVDSYIDYSKYSNVGIANVSSYLNIRKEPGTNKEIVGKLPPKAGCTIISVEDGWAKIKSGNVSGYVSADYILTGIDAVEKVKEYGRLVIVVDCDALRVREKASTDSKILTNIFKGEELIVLSSTKDWVKVEINNYTGYVSREFVNFSFELEHAVPIKKEETSGGANGTNASVRSSIIATAQKYLGNPYVYGGNSLTNGIDCSGFTQKIFAMYGYSLPRTSRTQANCGTVISASSAKAGDLVFYGSSSGISHVAICMGNGQIIHASNPRSGIKISNMYYTTPKKVVRIIKD